MKHKVIAPSLHKSIPLLTLFILVLTQLACSIGDLSPLMNFIFPGNPSHVYENAKFENHSGFREFSFMSHPLMRSVNIQVIIHIQEGSVVYTLNDPNGEVRWQGETTSGLQFDQAHGFGGISGNGHSRSN
ncbi:MAG: hypothetical protein IBX69_15660 [Anaerolineales bacterium]|nr:hypothetical protein [Anaerolineales bacterium]